LKIAHVNTHDISGGAAIAAYRLHTGLRQMGQESIMFVDRWCGDDFSIVKFQSPSDLVNRLLRHFRYERLSRTFNRYRATTPEGLDFFSDDRSPYGGSVQKQLPVCDVINLHWIAEFIDYISFFSRVPRHTPIVWTLHDMNPFTGGCHYDAGCGRYNQGCGECPQLGSSFSNDLSRRIWKRKEKAYRHLSSNGLTFIALNRWMADEIKSSTLLNRFPVRMIPNGVDTEIFQPIDKLIARKALNIPHEKKIILFSAGNIKNRRKGLYLLQNGLSALEETDQIFLLSVGGGASSVDLPIESLHIGPAQNDRFLSLLYNAADLYVIPSVQDNLPNTVLESMACGTPVIGFNVGGIPDMVRCGKTGYLVKPYETKALGAAISSMLKNTEKMNHMAQECRRVVLEHYTLERQAVQYIALYEELIAKSSQGSSN
jgi:glycosyltransferase involved in cell wall biosynthesis